MLYSGRCPTGASASGSAQARTSRALLSAVPAAETQHAWCSLPVDLMPSIRTGGQEVRLCRSMQEAVPSAPFDAMGNPLLLSQQRSLEAVASGVPTAAFKGAFTDRVRALNLRDGQPLNSRWATSVRRSVMPAAMVRLKQRVDTW